VQQQGEITARITANADSALAEIDVAARAARRSFERMEGIQGDAQIDSILTNIRLASVGIRQIVEGLAGSTGGLDATLTHADSAFAHIDRLASRLEAGVGSLGRLLSDTTFALRAEGVLLQIHLLLQELRENPMRYVRLPIF